MAIAFLPDGTVLASGGANRGSLYRFNSTGGTATTPLITLPQPIYDMAVDRNGSIWATTGGGSLLQLNSQTSQMSLTAWYILPPIPHSTQVAISSGY